MFFLLEVRSFLKRKNLDFAFLDSVQRAAYKDLVALLDDGSLLTDKEKIAKCEDSFRKNSENFQMILEIPISEIRIRLIPTGYESLDCNLNHKKKYFF